MAAPSTIPSPRGSISPRRASDLGRYLDRFLSGFSPADHVAMDPVKFVRAYSHAEDREVVGFISAAFAYGNVRSVVRSLSRVLDALGPQPARFARSFEPRPRKRLIRGFRHRWNDSRDLDVLIWIVGRLVETYGSLESAFVSGDTSRGSDRTGFTPAMRLDRFSERALGMGHERYYPHGELRRRRGVRYFFPMPRDGSACKRLNLFLRWMVRDDDGVDCGVWTGLEPSELIVPLDTHVARISQYIGLTRMSTPGWAMATDITRALARLDPRDPLRYEFALCHLGIAGDCPRKRDPLKCLACPIQAVCLL